MTTQEQILEAAERRIRAGGYHAVSFRDIAGDVGIKSSSVHHHFPTKEDLGAAVARGYTDRVMATLGDPDDPNKTPGELIRRYMELFRGALVHDREMCLCGVLASETAALPPAVHAAAHDFFTRSIAWLESVLRRQRPYAKPSEIRAETLKIAATLQGALLLRNALGSDETFETIAKSIEL